VLSGAFVLGALSRLALVGLLDTTQFLTQGSDIRYLLPAHAFLVAFAVVGTAQFADAIWTLSMPPQEGPPPAGAEPRPQSQPADSGASAM
jgi:hypothetical protein